jgi:hypothetical protein
MHWQSACNMPGHVAAVQFANHFAESLALAFTYNCNLKENSYPHLLCGTSPQQILKLMILM